MAATTAREDYSRRSGGVAVNGARTYVRAWEVHCDAPTDGVVAALAHPDLPRTSDFYLAGAEWDEQSFVQSLSVELLSYNGDSVDYLVTANYGPFDAPSYGTEPLEWPIRIRASFQQYEKVIWVDQDGKAVRNSAGDPFGDPVVVDDSRPMLVVTRNESVNAFNLTLAAQQKDKVNAAVWNGFPARTVKCSDIQTGDEQKDPATSLYYYSVSYVFDIKWETWTREILDQGFAYLDGSTRKPFLDDEGQPISDPKLLDGLGEELDASMDPPVLLSYRVYPDTDFTVFNMDFAEAIGRF